ncbi:hypothetical protein ACFFX0_22115 [Citricoccus parietis]|uniref:Uncharacterized protein n=1 Tax=Citricoccus parietis TaxID=592307 RepID=A0ABV5G493_9MICC
MRRSLRPSRRDRHSASRITSWRSLPLNISAARGSPGCGSAATTGASGRACRNWPICWWISPPPTPTCPRRCTGTSCSPSSTRTSPRARSPSGGWPGWRPGGSSATPWWSCRRPRAGARCTGSTPTWTPCSRPPPRAPRRWPA